MKAKKKSKTQRDRRGKDRLSDSMKSFKSTDAIWHLFGKSFKHQLDALLSERWQQEQSRKTMLKKVPRHLHSRVEALVKQVAKYRKELQAAVAEGLVDVGFTPQTAETVEEFGVVELKDGRAGVGAGKLVTNLIHAGPPGLRKWKGCDELEWSDHLEEEMAYRALYVTEDRHHLEDEKKLWNLYARLPPWVALVAGEKLDSDDGVKQLQELVVNIAGEFAEELGVDVVGIAIHRENDQDLHAHFIFSLTREKPVEKELGKTLITALAKKIAEQISEERNAHGLPKLGRNKLRELAREKIASEKLDMEQMIERQRRQFPRPRQILGPSFRGKLALWLASGCAEDIAKMGDRARSESNTFRGKVSEPVTAGEDITKKFIDLWVERKFEQGVKELLEPDDLLRMDRLAANCVASYRKTGSATPSVEDFIVAEVAGMKDSLPSEISKDLEDRACRLDEREKIIKKRERQLEGALVITDEIRKEFGVPKTHDAHAVLASLVEAKEKAERRLKAVLDYIEKELAAGKDKLGEALWLFLQLLLKLLKPAKKKKTIDQVMGQ